MSQATTSRQAKIDQLLAEPFDNAGQCEALCNQLENISEELDGATGKLRTRLLIQLHAIQARRTSLHCGTCFFQ